MDIHSLVIWILIIETFIQCRSCPVYNGITVLLLPQDKQVQHISDRTHMRDVSPPAAPRSRSQPAPIPARRRSAEHAPKRPQHPTRKSYNGQEPKPRQASRAHSHPPAPKVVVDTGSPLKAHKVRERDLSNAAPKVRMHSPPPPARKVVVDAGSPVKAARFKAAKKPIVPKIDVSTETDRMAEKAKRNEVTAEKGNGRHRKSADNVHEFVQTDIDRGRGDQGQDAPVRHVYLFISFFLLYLLGLVGMGNVK